MDTVISPPVTDEDEHAIRNLVRRAHDAQSDLDTLLAMHAPDVVIVIVNVAGRRVLGRGAFADAMAGALASPLAEVRTSVAIVDVRLATADVAIVSCIKTIHDGRVAAATSTTLPSAGALTYVMTRGAGQWRIAVAQTTPLLGGSAEIE